MSGAVTTILPRVSPFLHRRRDRAVILQRHLHVLALLARQGHDQIPADGQRHAGVVAEPDIGVVDLVAGGEQVIVVEFAERPFGQPLALLGARFHRRQAAQHHDDATAAAHDRSRSGCNPASSVWPVFSPSAPMSL